MNDLRGAMTETRKLAAILAADMVGYSRLAGADEERTLARLRALRAGPARSALPRLSMVVLPLANVGDDPEQEHFVDRVTEPHHRSLADTRRGRDRPQYGVRLQRQATRREGDRARTERPLCPRGQRPAWRQPHARQCPAHRRRERQSKSSRALRGR